MEAKKLCVMLVDDDDSTNELHQLVLEENGCAEQVIVFEYAEKALKYLKDNNAPGFVKPDLVFLDLNMPRMTGWEFLEEFKKLPVEYTSGIVVYLLTTSLNPDDKARGESDVSLSGFYGKPLTEGIVSEVLAKHFSNRPGII